LHEAPERKGSHLVSLAFFALSFFTVFYILSVATVIFFLLALRVVVLPSVGKRSRAKPQNGLKASDHTSCSSSSSSYSSSSSSASSSSSS
jgi:hypothetical protein